MALKIPIKITINQPAFSLVSSFININQGPRSTADKLKPHKKSVQFNAYIKW